MIDLHWGHAPGITLLFVAIILIHFLIEFAKSKDAYGMAVVLLYFIICVFWGGVSLYRFLGGTNLGF